MTREEFRRMYKDFIDDNDLINGLKERGLPTERLLIEQLSLVLQFGVFEEVLFGKGDE